MKKAQNLIEVSLILVLVVVVSLALWPMLNNQKTKLAELSKSKVSTQSISGRQIQLKNDALNFAGDMGLTVNNPNDTKAILDETKKKIDELSANPNPNASQLALLETYTNQYKKLSDELSSINAAALTINDNTTIAGAQGGKISSNPIKASASEKQGTSTATRTDITGKYAYQPRPGEAPPKVDATGTVANDDDIEESQYALKTKP